MLLNTRALAIKSGDKNYNTGKKCKYGHLSIRNTIDGSCRACRNAKQNQQRKEIRESLDIIE